jgi:hypothetical protein
MDTIRSIQTVTDSTLIVQVPPELQGQRVEVQVRVLGKSREWGEGLRRCAGALSGEWNEEDDRILSEIYQDRKRDARLEIRE